MRYLLFISIIIFANINVLQGQNLVPNPSFEDTVSCPMFIDQINLATGWSAYKESPDYFNSCNTLEFGVPNNTRGSQFAVDGSAYAGIGCFNYGLPDVREIIGIELLQPLQIGQTYYISVYFSLADTFGFDCAINHLGVKFSDISYSFTNPAPINNSADVYFNSFIDDKTNWTQLTGTFVPTLSYQYLMIGNFFDDQNTDTINCLSWAMYYVDMICVSLDSNDCDLPSSLNSINTDLDKWVELYPNPAVNSISVVSKDVIHSLILYENNGAKIKTIQTNNELNYKIDLSGIRPGFYYIELLTGTKSSFHKFVKY